MTAEVTKYGILDCQVCVPATWTDAEIIAFANSDYPTGTENGWQIRRQGDEYLKGDNERTKCADRNGFIHVMMDC